MSNSPKIIVITGAESTGKSVLTEALANHFEVPFIPEIARGYVEKLNRKYNYRDVEQIAREQIGLLSRLSNTKVPFLFVDTWLIITKIWFEVVFKDVPEWIEKEIRQTKIDLFLICDTNLPWIPDPVRENGGENREILQKKYIEEIKRYHFKYNIVSGKDEKRLANALEFIKNL